MGNLLKVGVDHSVDVKGLFEAAESVRNLGDRHVEVSKNLENGIIRGTENIKEGTVQSSRNIKEGAIDSSHNIKDALIISSKTLSDTARYVSDTTNKNVEIARADIAKSLLDASAKISEATKLGSESAKKIAYKFGDDYVKSCQTLSKVLLSLSNQVENTAIVTSANAEMSLERLSSALLAFGNDLNSVSENHRQVSKNLQDAIVDGSKNLVAASKEIKEGFVYFGSILGYTVCATAFAIVLYLNPPHYFYALVEDFNSVITVWVPTIGVCCLSYFAYCAYSNCQEMNIRHRSLLQELKLEVKQEAKEEIRQELKQEVASLIRKETDLLFTQQVTSVSDLREVIMKELEMRITLTKANQLVAEAIGRLKK